MAISPVVAVRKHLGREPLQSDVGKTDRRHRATGGNGQRCKPPVRLQQSQIIGRIHLNHLGVNQTCAREQTNSRGINTCQVLLNRLRRVLMLAVT